MGRAVKETTKINFDKYVQQILRQVLKRLHCSNKTKIETVKNFGIVANLKSSCLAPSITAIIHVPSVKREQNY